MTDNIVEFPKNELEVEFTPEGDSDVDQVANAFICLGAGVREMGNVDYDALFYGAIAAAGWFAAEMGMSAQEFSDLLKQVEVREEKRPTPDPLGA